MKAAIAIYLAGGIKKGHEKEGFFWTDDDLILLRKHLANFDVSFLNPAFRTDDLSHSKSVFGRDMLQVFTSHVVFVDARDRRGLGVGAEMMWAKLNKIPVVTWAPRNTHYRKDTTTLLDVPVENYIHPFVDSLSDKIVDNLIEGAQWIDFIFSNPSVEIKGIPSIESAMQHYKDHQLHHDIPMKELIAANEELNQRINRSCSQLIGL